MRDVVALLMGHGSTNPSQKEVLPSFWNQDHSRVWSDAVITGTIDEYGNIGQVEGIVYKAEAAAKAGAKIFLVPPGQSVDVVY